MISKQSILSLSQLSQKSPFQSMPHCESLLYYALLSVFDWVSLTEWLYKFEKKNVYFPFMSCNLTTASDLEKKKNRKIFSWRKKSCRSKKAKAFKENNIRVHHDSPWNAAFMHLMYSFLTAEVDVFNPNPFCWKTKKNFFLTWWQKSLNLNLITFK